MFVLKSAMEVATIKVGDTVKFAIEQGRNGPQAANIQPLSSVESFMAAGEVGMSRVPDTLTQLMSDAGVATAAPQGFSSSPPISIAAPQQFAAAGGPQAVGPSSSPF